MSFTERYQKLNNAQKQAVDTIDGPVMVVAGPGTGKTELLSVRAANILQKTDTLPENILCLTFTESGQAAMRERLVGIIGKDAYKVAIHTFHSFGSEVMAQNREYFYQSAVFQPADDIKQYEILRNIFEELPYTNPLASTMNGEFTHLADAKKVISELKRSSALTSDELLEVIEQSEASLDTIERTIIPILTERVSKKTAEALQSALHSLETHVQTLTSLHEVPPLARVIVDSLRTMLEACKAVHPTKPLSAWKAQWLERDDSKQLVFKDRKRLHKLKALAFVYYEYLSRMEKASLYDYDDMIMQVVHAIEVHDDLKFNLQEKYLYIMVDEFQDTNLAQLRILHNLTDNPINEDTPNILVVGDDDQAVYGFQGADISNILNFSEHYPRRELIVLTDNYRSNDVILQASRDVIIQGTDRLEQRIPALNKQLTAHSTAPSTSVQLWQTPSIDTERAALIKDIRSSIEKGANPSSIAVLARRHADIQSLLPFFHHANIAVRYEKEESVLESAPIKALTLTAQVVMAIAEGHHDHTEALLPELLSHPAWNLSAHTIWRLSLDAYTHRQHWLECMATTPELISTYEWLIERAQDAQHLTLEPMIDALIEGPLFSYFFSPEKLAQDPDAYIDYLSALRTIRAKLREYAPGEALSLRGFLDFIDLHQRLDLTITSTRLSVASDTPAVNLLTAHKSKGLEFDHVYVFNAVDTVWGQRARTVSRSLSYPANLPLAPSGGNADERLRLFYVAMTRAKQQLIMSFSQRSDADKPTLAADFLLPIGTSHPTLVVSPPTHEEEATISELAWYEPLVTPTSDLKTLLAPHLESFKLSATSLNSFLDVSRGGPQHFLLNNLLHFPRAKLASASYGTAVHYAMQQAHTHMRATGQQKPLEDILRDFEVALGKERLSTQEFQHYLQQGSEQLPQFIQSGVLPVTATQKAEVSFAHQDVRLGNARLTGALDVIDIDKDSKTVSVIDYKTGHPSVEWEKGSDAQKLKLHKYRQQLIFYKILIEHSAEYGHYTATHGALAFIEPTKAGESIVLELDLTTEDIERTKKLIEAVCRHITSLDLPDVTHYSPDLKGVLAFEQDLIDEIV